jgi:hypothetical protein
MKNYTKFLETLAEWSPIVVRWHDAHSPTAEWHTVDDYEPDKDTTAVTLGWYWKNCKANYLTVAATIFPHPETGAVKTAGDITHIPLGWLEDIQKLEDIHANPPRPETSKSRRNRL